MHSFHAFIDESGDDGFVFKDPPQRASSEWFVSSAVVVRDTLRVPVSNDINNSIVKFESERGSVLHFTRLQHDQRKYVAQVLGGLRVRLIHVCINKRRIPLGHGMNQERRLHHYSLRLLLERISWLCRDKTTVGEGDGRCKLNFSRCKNLSYNALSDYFAVLKATQTNIAWPHLDSENFNVDSHENSIWLRTADIAASGIAKGLELGEHGLSEDAYARLMRPNAYTYKNGKCLAYGLKFLGPPPAVEKERDNRYEWLSLYA